MAEPILVTYTGAAVNAAAELIPSVPLPNGTITKLRVKLKAGNTTGDAIFRFFINGVEQAADLTVPDGDDEIDVTGLSYATTEDDTGTFNIISPLPSSLPNPPYNFYIYYTSATELTAASTTEVLTGTSTAKAVTPDALAALWEQGSDITSAATISVGEGGYFNVTGSTGPITDIDFGTTKAGRIAWLKFASTPTLTHHATTLILPTGANITAAAGDVAGFVSEGGDNVRCFSYMKADGTSLVGSGSGVDTANSPNAGEFARFTDADTIEGRTVSEAVSDLGLEIGADVQEWSPFLDDIAFLADPDADRILFWDDSAGIVEWLTIGTNLSITGTTLSASLAGGAVDTANSPNANEYARFTDADTIEGRTEAEFKADMNLEIGTDVQAWDAQLDTWATITPGTGVGTQLALAADGSDSDAIGFRGIPQNAQTGNYTLVMADAGKHIYHASGAGAGDTYTIPANASVAYEVGTAITFVNSATDSVSIAITSDTMTLAGTTTTGTRTLAQNGVATAIKVTSTAWIISGSGLT